MHRKRVLTKLAVYVPEEIVTEILLKLPVRSLMRCNCVSKTWRALIRNLSIGHKHLNRNNNRNNSVFLIRQIEDNRFSNESEKYHELLLTHKCDKDDNPGDYHHYYNNFSLLVLSSCLPPDEPQLQLYGSCNGILCISKWVRRPYLYNPVTRECLKLPDSSANMNGSWDRSLMGFGFDALTNDYKVMSCLDVNALINNPIRVFEVTLTLGKLGPAAGVFVNGSCHWVGEYRLTNFILKFDFQTEIFGIIKFPSSKEASGTGGRNSSISVLGDSLALIIEKFMRGFFEVWVMTHQDGEGPLSWSKRCTVRVGHNFSTVLTCWDNDWILLRSYCGRHAKSYFLGDGDDHGDGDGDSATGDMNNWGFNVGRCDSLSAVVFQPTLVSLRHTN
ncbi:OLC1v1009351C1 [Oldenlandia corymbosa var. corymbosa]|uniref:OLC1v1009351C1 n=1 Tax=Oldenlandia corymbosa var. corymbosa TaxID=529605 RepID=A0AAV1DRX8_OLDCO|nr:OLC1v1009351C1 [Oldenlandia corymbosa var. corymbosa]